MTEISNYIAFKIALDNLFEDESFQFHQSLNEYKNNPNIHNYVGHVCKFCYSVFNPDMPNTHNRYGWGSTPNEIVHMDDCAYVQFKEEYNKLPEITQEEYDFI